MTMGQRTNSIPTRAEAKQRRAEEAKVRQLAYDSLSDEEKAKRNPTKP